MHRPTVFISSTIYDFFDLRGSIKDYLETRGCKVYASEYTDFNPSPELHSYDACLRNVDLSDIFILLIGKRVGGFYNSDDKVSITRKEYQHAYALAAAGRIKIITFVRSDVWAAKGLLDDLRKLLGNDDPSSDASPQAVLNKPNRYMDDAQAISAFINEVSRNAETKDALSGAGTLPINNWIMPFTTFREIRQAIDPMIAGGFNVEQAAGRKALEAQLLQMLTSSVYKFSGKLLVPRTSFVKLRDKFALKGREMHVSINVDRDDWFKLFRLSTIYRPRQYAWETLSTILSTSLLLAYKPTESRFESTPEHMLLSKIVSAGRALDNLPNDDLVSAYSVDVRSSYQVTASTLASLLARVLFLIRLLESALELLSRLRGKNVRALPPLPRSPYVDQEQELEAEQLTIEDINRILDERERPGTQI